MSIDQEDTAGYVRALTYLRSDSFTIVNRALKIGNLREAARYEWENQPSDLRLSLDDVESGMVVLVEHVLNTGKVEDGEGEEKLALLNSFHKLLRSYYGV